MPFSHSEGEFLRTLGGLSTLMIIFTLSVILTGCLEQRPSKVSSGKSASSSSTSSESDPCSTFLSNSFDYQLCQGCRTSTGSTNLTTLAQCVHANSGSTGGANCTGLTCGTGQTPNFTTCSCQDSSGSSGNGGTQPGQEDQSTPTLFPGFNISSRYCDVGSNYFRCLDNGDISGLKSSTSSPLNVFTDTGYVRWDLGMDESQFSPLNYLKKGVPFNYSSATVAGNYSLMAQLKPNTALNSSTVKVRDCVENFSGYLNGGSPSYTTPMDCDSDGNAATNTMTFTGFSASNGTASAQISGISMNGGAANFNLTQVDLSNNLKLSSGATTSVGIGKTISGQNTFPTTTTGLGLFSNVGALKYTWKNISISRPNTTSTLLTAKTSSSFNINMNLGYTPLTAIDSTAFSPLSILGTVSQRTCSTTLGNCVVTAVYRSTGGSVLSQSFSPQFNFHSSSVSSLPSGVTAVSTPKIIEDTSQFVSGTDDNKPARLRVFVRGSDGNIYMTRGIQGQWASWTNLGRPWVAANNAVATGGPYASAYPPLKPYTNTAAAAADVALANPYSGTPNDGISIAGEPMIASYMSTPAVGSPVIGYVFVFVRVSQYKTTGLTGEYHNSVFYTFTATSNTAYTNNTTLDIDKLSRWSPWMPIEDSTGGILQIQGNPAVMIANPSAAAPSVYLFATQSVGAATMNFHPPISPDNTKMYLDNETGAGGGNVDFTANWFNYGDTTVRIGKNISAYGAAGTNPGSITAPIAWSAAQTNSVAAELAAASTALTKAVISSDWKITSDPTAGTVHFIAMALAGGNAGTVANKGYGYHNEAGNGNTARSPGEFRHKTLIKYEITTLATPAANSGLDFTAGKYFRYVQGLKFHGSPMGVEISTNAYANQLKFTNFPEGVAQSTSGATTETSNRILVTGRYTCPTDIELDENVTLSTVPCDNAIPTLAYGIMKAPSAATPDTDGGDMDPEDDQYSALYHYGGATITESDGSGPSTYHYSTNQSYYAVMPMYITSDVVPVISSGLSYAGVDVPVYLFSRDNNGRILVGYWGSTNGGLNGPKQFQLYSTGAFTN